MVSLNQLLNSKTQGMLKKFPKPITQSFNNFPQLFIDLLTWLHMNFSSPVLANPSISPNKANCGSNHRTLMEIIWFGSLGSIPSFSIKFSLWTSTRQAVMQHNTVHTIPTPIPTNSTFCRLATLNIQWSNHWVMKHIQNLNTKKLIKGTLTLPMWTSKLLLCLIKKVFPVALTTP